MVGEILFDLRCALDHLVYELHVTRYRKLPPDEVERTTMFPIFDKETQFKNIGLKRIKSLSSRDIGAIRQYQPYITRRDKLAKVRGHLQTLERLHNIDKHRKLHVVTQSQRSAPYPLHSFPTECGFETDPTWGPVDSGDQIDRWTFVRVPPQMEEHPGATLEVAIQLGDEWGPLLPLLLHTTTHVRTVIDRFADRLD